MAAAGDKNPPPPPKEALGASEAFLAFSEALSLAAKVDRPVLIMGERGTGKELAAARLHYLSPRWQGPLIALNCAALAPSLLEDELFGHEPGAFTGAQARRAGRFEAADGGTLFLDELGSIPLTVQEKILRVVEYGSFERLGGSLPVSADVRIIGATNADLRVLCQKGEFKADLLDRLSFEVLHLPPLRERTGDILLLARHFAAAMAQELGLPQVPYLSPRAEQALLDYRWPGNVRELKNVIERAVYKSGSPEIQDIVFDPFPGCEPAPAPQTQTVPVTRLPDPPKPLPFKQAVTEYERGLIKQALTTSRYNQREAAQALGLTYHQLRGLLRKHGGVEAVLEEE